MIDMVVKMLGKKHSKLKSDVLEGVLTQTPAIGLRIAPQLVRRLSSVFILFLRN